jgi:hypothetical protein
MSVLSRGALRSGASDLLLFWKPRNSRTARLN